MAESEVSEPKTPDQPILRRVAPSAFFVAAVFWALWFGGSVMIVIAVGLNFGGGYHTDPNQAAAQATATFQAFGYLEGFCLMALVAATMSLFWSGRRHFRRTLTVTTVALFIVALIYLLYIVPAIARLNDVLDFSVRPLSSQRGGEVHELLHRTSTTLHAAKMILLIVWGYCATASVLRD